jgi:hypothetical protein
LIDEFRLLSSFTTAEGVRVWLTTEADDDTKNRIPTTALLPEDC